MEVLDIKELYECKLIESERGYGQRVIETRRFTTQAECQMYKVDNEDFEDSDCYYKVEVTKLI